MYAEKNPGRQDVLGDRGGQRRNMNFVSVSLLRPMIESGFLMNSTEDPGFGPPKYGVQRVWISADHLRRWYAELHLDGGQVMVYI